MNYINFKTSNKTHLRKRVESFTWRTVSFGIVAVSTYLMNVSNIREIDFDKLFTILIVAISANITGEITKYLNK